MRTLQIIAREITVDWASPSLHAQPYLSAMHSLRDIDSKYYADSARDIVLRFLSNAGSWRGEVARRIKAELKEMLK